MTKSNSHWPPHLHSRCFNTPVPKPSTRSYSRSEGSILPVRTGIPTIFLSSILLRPINEELNCADCQNPERLTEQSYVQSPQSNSIIAQPASSQELHREPSTPDAFFYPMSEERIPPTHQLDNKRIVETSSENGIEGESSIGSPIPVSGWTTSALDNQLVSYGCNTTPMFKGQEVYHGNKLPGKRSTLDWSWIGRLPKSDSAIITEVLLWLRKSDITSMNTFYRKIFQKLDSQTCIDLLKEWMMLNNSGAVLTFVEPDWWPSELVYMAPEQFEDDGMFTQSRLCVSFLANVGRLETRCVCHAT